MMEGLSLDQVGTMPGPSAPPSHQEILDRWGWIDKHIHGPVFGLGIRWEPKDPVAEQLLEDALFLFALRKVQEAAAQDLQQIWERYQYWWIRRLPKAAYYYVKCEAARRATEGQECAGPSLPECRQITMRETIIDDDEVPF